MPSFLAYPSLGILEAVEGTCDQRGHWSDCTDGRDDQSISWSHKSYYRFCHALAQIYLFCCKQWNHCISEINKNDIFTQWKDMIFSLVKNNMVMLFSLLVSNYFSCLNCFPNRCQSHEGFLCPCHFQWGGAYSITAVRTSVCLSRLSVPYVTLLVSVQYLLKG